MNHHRWKVSAPKASGAFLKYYSLREGAPGDSIALIRTGNLCSTLCRTRSTHRCSSTASELEVGVSGFLSAHGSDKVFSSIECMNTDQAFQFACREDASRRMVDLGIAPAGNFKVCYRKPAISSYYTDWAEWEGTGLQVHVQDSVTGLSINGAGGERNPAQAQRVVIPMMRFHTLAYLGLRSGKLKMLRGNDDCTDFSDASTAMPLAVNQIEHAVPGVEMVGRLVDDFLYAGMGQYQVCFIQKGNSTFQSTGVAITIQNYTDGLEVNGIRPNRGLRISIPRSKSSRLRFFRRGLEMEVGDKVSFIRLEDHCFDPSHNPSNGNIHQSGHMVVKTLPLIGNSVYRVLSGIDAVAAMGGNTQDMQNAINMYKVMPCLLLLTCCCSVVEVLVWILISLACCFSCH